MSIQEHLEQREAQQRQIRRDAYVKLLTQYEQAIKLLDEYWREPAPATPYEVELLRQKVTEQTRVIGGALITVYLEGPENVRKAASKLGTAFSGQVDLIYNCAKENAGKAGRLVDFRRNPIESVQTNLWEIELKVIQEAAKALDDITVLRWADNQG
jgi:hypothetical protein